ncbi:MAG: 23S rRNA (uracil(1939)-C(5))-methyltransferase RlmD, partial [Acidimicrobiia bacterium]|nr:23S rRNA (uracil(1939)-C(5))-methyltransferase RlmD [Acidimicrobiia bacterium]
GLRDLEHNLAEADGPAADIVAIPFEESAGEYDDWTIAVCDPPRTGLGSAGVDALVDARPRRVAYVSCDPASFARDARMIVDQGYLLEWVAPVDMFPQTYHIEMVARFDRVDPPE